jgi:hypothetical protein
MTVYELKQGVVQRTYKNTTGMQVTFTSFEENKSSGAIKISLADGRTLSAKCYINQEFETIYLSIMENQYVFRLSGSHDHGIASFDLLQGDEIIHSFSLVS